MSVYLSTSVHCDVCSFWLDVNPTLSKRKARSLVKGCLPDKLGTSGGFRYIHGKDICSDKCEAKLLEEIKAKKRRKQ